MLYHHGQHAEETKLSKMRENVVRASNEILTGVEEKFTIVRKERFSKLERRGIAHPYRFLA